MNQPLQTAALANLIVASRLPAEGNFRRDAMLGAMVGQVNPLAGALVAIRSADSLTALVRERDALRAQQSAAPTPAPPVPAPPVGGAGKPPAMDEEGRRALQEWLRKLIAAATELLEGLNATPAAAAEQAGSSEQTNEEMARKFTEAATAVAAALTHIADQAEAAVANQDENQAMMRQILERLSASASSSPAASSTAKGKTE